MKVSMVLLGLALLFSAQAFAMGKSRKHVGRFDISRYESRTGRIAVAGTMGDYTGSPCAVDFFVQPLEPHHLYFGVKVLTQGPLGEPYWWVMTFDTTAPYSVKVSKTGEAMLKQDLGTDPQGPHDWLCSNGFQDTLATHFKRQVMLKPGAVVIRDNWHCPGFLFGRNDYREVSCVFQQ